MLLLSMALLAVAGCDRPADDVPPAEVGATVKGVDRGKAGAPAPAAELRDAEGEAASLAAATGEPLLVNLWATWCAPCVKELPTLEALAAKPGAPRVIAVSQDMAPRTSIDAFVAKHGLDGLEIWHDRDMLLSGELGAEVLPTTILYDAQGREVWRYVGDLDWSGAEAARLLGEAPAAAAD